MKKERQEEAQERQAEKKREAAKLSREDAAGQKGHASDDQQKKNMNMLFDRMVDKLVDSDAQDGDNWRQRLAQERTREAAKLARERAEMRKERQEEAQERQAEKKREAAKLAQKNGTERNGHTSDNQHMTMSALLNNMGTDEFAQKVVAKLVDK